MIPVRLTVKNFLSYGEQVPTLDFTPLHVVCLSGDNGHGKSALLDAITWAVWGEARKAAGDRKPDEGLLRTGATEMAVEFEFTLEEDRYRILRQFQRTGRSGKSALEFQIYDRATEEFRSNTDTTINRTQQRITETLRMDYQTFINSVFILQGRADEFTKRSARERKDILAYILGLGRYDELRERARIHAQAAAKKQEDRIQRLQQIEEALRDREKNRQDMNLFQEEIDRVTAELQDADQKLEALREQKSEIEGAKRQMKELQAQAGRLDDEHETLNAQITRQRSVVSGYQAALADREKIEQAFRNHQSLVEERDTLADKLQTLRRLERQRIDIERSVDEARHQIEQERQVVDARIDSIRQTVSETEALLRQCEAIEKGYHDLQQARQADEAWEEKRRCHDEIERRLRTCQDEIVKARTALESELGGYRHRLQDLENRAGNISLYKEQVSNQQQQLDGLLKLERQQQEIAERGRTLNGHIEVLKNKIKLYEQGDEEAHGKLKVLRRGTTTHCPLCDAALDERRRRTIEINLSEQIKTHAEEIQKLRQGIRIAEDEKKSLTLRYKENRPKLASTDEIRRALADAEGRVRDAAAATNEIRTLREQIEALQQRLSNGRFAPDRQETVAALQREQAALGYDTAEHQKTREVLRELQPYEAEKARLDAAVGRHEKASASLPALQEKQTTLDKQLQTQSYAIEEHAILEKIHDEIRRVGYNEDRHKQVEHDLRQARQAPERYDQLTQAIRQYDTATQTLSDLETRAQQLKTDHTTVSKRISDLEQRIGQASKVEREIMEQGQTRTELRKILDEANRRLGAAERQAEQYKTLEGERPSVEKEQQAAVRDVQVYERLAVAFGKDGIPALIIENTIPEIEEEANRILSRLTGNRTQVTIEPLRDLKTGGTRETLDIKISDEMGTRNYEMFSGGEAFRTNFAIRIALSKLLAHRAGTRLKTLVIDEGFGTQDAQGLEYLIEAIQEIQSDFEKIIVVTHLEQLKNAFPARIEVVKHPDIGSSFEVIV